jgi:hypothetical protein
MSGVSPLDVEDFEAICEVSKPVQLMQFRRFDDFRQFFELVHDLGIFEEQFIHQWWPQALASGPC